MIALVIGLGVYIVLRWVQLLLIAAVLVVRLVWLFVCNQAHPIWAIGLVIAIATIAIVMGRLMVR